MQATLNPGETFSINRILADHTDTTTYYIQAKIYNAATRALVATKSLTDNGDRWFSASYKVPHDNVFGNGTRLLIITSVYTDSGYTTKSPNHGDESEEYLVQQRWNPSVNFGGGGSTLDEAMLTKIVSAIIEEKLKPLVELEPVKFPEVDTAKLLSDFCEHCDKTLASYAAEIPPATPPVDLTPLREQMTALARAIIERPRFQPTDLAPVAAALQNVQATLDARFAELSRTIQTSLQPLIAENEKLRTLTNGAGGKLTIEQAEKPDARQIQLKRLAMKNGIPVTI